MPNVPYNCRSASSLNQLNNPHQGRQHVKFGSILCTPSLCTDKYLCVVSSQKVRAYFLSENFSPALLNPLQKPTFRMNTLCLRFVLLTNSVPQIQYSCLSWCWGLVWVEYQELAMKQALIDDLYCFQWSSVMHIFQHQ
jgi:hypothetical protein